MNEANTIFVELLKNSITPIALISGVGLILLTVSNRLGRTIDRSRALIQDLEKEENQKEPLKTKKVEQLHILHRRNKYLRNSVLGIAFSIMASSLMVPVLIFEYIYHPNLQVVEFSLFVISIIGIICSAFFLFLDVSLTLKALEKEGEEYLKH